VALMSRPDKTEWHARPKKFRKIESLDGTRTYYLPIEGVNAADHFRYVVNCADGVHVTDPNPSGPFRGYGGSTLEFPLDDGTIDKVKGPWHTNSEAFFKETGINISDLHLTQVTIGTESGKGFMEVGGDVLYRENEPVLGPFMRGERIAQQLADVLDISVYCVRESAGGGSAGWHKPGQKLHPMAERQ
jgi:hypothetical protein